MARLGYSAALYLPSDLLAEYKGLTVDAAGRDVTVAVNRYRCRRPEYGGTADAEEVKDGFLNASRKEIIAEAGGVYAFVGVFTGKGSPEEVATLLGLVYSYRKAFVRLYAKDRGSRGQCARLFEDNEGHPRAMLQKFCDQYLGLDCNGFVCNYIHRVNPKVATQYDSIPSILGSRSRVAVRQKAADIEIFDVLIWPGSVHIGIVDEFVDLGDGTTKAVVAQSTKGGPQVGTFDFVPAGGGRFRLAPTPVVAGAVQVISLGLNEQG